MKKENSCIISEPSFPSNQVTTFKSGVEFKVHSAREQVNNTNSTFFNSVQSSMHKCYLSKFDFEQVNTLVTGVESQVHSAREQVN